MKESPCGMWQAAGGSQHTCVHTIVSVFAISGIHIRIHDRVRVQLSEKQREAAAVARAC